MSEIISRAGAEQARKARDEQEYAETIDKINGWIPGNFKDEENFGMLIPIRPEVLPRIMATFAKSDDWNCVGYVQGVLQIRSKKNGK